MARKVYCKNTSCKHHSSKNGCDTVVKIGSEGKCCSFEKGFAYYFHLVWDALANGNFIDAIKLQMSPDLRIGLYYVMECYELGFSEMEWGTCRMIMLKDGEKGAGLKYEEIIKREINTEKFRKHLNDFNNGIMPNQKRQQEAEEQPVKTEEKPDRDFGWVSPTGEFTESPFGTHEESAEQIIKRKGFMDEYWEWRDSNKDVTENRLMRDFLSEVKGYCLIHNPFGDGGYIVTNRKNLTKKQKEFLYEYFMDKGDRFKAEQYIGGEDE